MVKYGELEKKEVYDDYDNLLRWISYFSQIRNVQEINKMKDKLILEIGPGNKTVSNYLKFNGHNLKTMDYNQNLTPDMIGDVTKIPLKDNAVDIILCCEVLEHLPFEEFEIALKEMKRVSEEYIILSLPYNVVYFSWAFNTTWAKGLMEEPKGKTIRLSTPIKHKFRGAHYWEIGKRDYPIKKIRQIIHRLGFEIVKEETPLLNGFHQFFVLKKNKNLIYYLDEGTFEERR